jgi:C4-dicarboxylate-specific signal transduction histidine kinase
MTGDVALSVGASTQPIRSRAVPKFVATDVNDIVHTVAGCGRSYLSKKTALTLEMCCEPQRIQGNQERLTDVLFALLFRAERSIAIAARPTGAICIRTWATDGEVRLSLSSNGFDTSIGDTVGTDRCLSLTECAEIISDHGGRVYSWRPSAGGATYTIVLPVIQSQS